MDAQVIEGSGYDAIIALLDNLRGVEFPCVVLESGNSGTCQVYDGPVDTYTQSIWVMGQMGREEDEALLYAQMKQLARKVIAKLLDDFRKEVPQVADIDWNRFTYIRHGGGQNARGYEIIFTFRENCSLLLSPEDFKPVRLADYFYRQDFHRLDYEYAMNWFLSHNPQISPAGCTAVSHGDYTGRNHDWFYDRQVEFLVKTARSESRLATMGIAGDISALTKDAVERASMQEMYRLIPFFTLDGINEEKVFCCTNVVPLDKGATSVSVPLVEEKVRICSVMLTRYVLDHFSTAQQAVEYLRDYVAIYPPKSLQDQGFETHWAIRDLQDCYVLEIIGNSVVFERCTVMSNFYVNGVTFNEEGKVWTPEDVAAGHLPSSNGITPHGSGLERHNYAMEHIQEAISMEKMRELMTGLFYTRTYLSAPAVANPVWHSEYVGTLTVDDPAEAFADVEARYAEIFSERDRDTPEDRPRTWHTTHSSVYDLANLKLSVISQEDMEHEFRFGL